MTDTITLPRAVGEEVRDLLCHADFTHFHFAAKRREMLLRAATALAALDAALAEPGPTGKDSLQVASENEVEAMMPRPAPSLAFLDGFRDGFLAAEKFHGITKEDGK